MLIDADFYSYVLTDIKRHFGAQLNRELPNADLAKFVGLLALSADVETGNNEIMVAMVHDKDTRALAHSTPARLKEELNEKAFKNGLGEFQFTTMSTEDLTTNEGLFMEVLNMVADAPEVERIILLPHENLYARQVSERLEKVKNKKIILFGMIQPQPAPKHYRWEVLAFPLMQALGIRSDEL